MNWILENKKIAHLIVIGLCVLVITAIYYKVGPIAIPAVVAAGFIEVVISLDSVDAKTKDYEDT